MSIASITSKGFVIIAALAVTAPANAQMFSRTVNLPGFVAAGVAVCWSPSDVDFDLGASCIPTPMDHRTPVEVLNVDGSVATIRVLGNIMFAYTDNVVVIMNKKIESVGQFLIQKNKLNRL